MKTRPAHPEVPVDGQPELTAADVAYVRTFFRCQTDAERTREAAGCAPRPAYLLPDGTPMVSAAPDQDLAAAHNVDNLRGRFTKRWLKAGGRAEDIEDNLAEWLAGTYSVCLRSPCPEYILAKAGVAQAIKALTALPAPKEKWWCDTLGMAVAAYDSLVLPFASIDPSRFGRSTSRAHLIESVRKRWSSLFGPEPTEG